MNRENGINRGKEILTACKVTVQTLGYTGIYSGLLICDPRGPFTPVLLREKTRKQGKGTFRKLNWNCSLEDHRALTTAKASFVSKLCKLFYILATLSMTQSLSSLPMLSLPF